MWNRWSAVMLSGSRWRGQSWLAFRVKDEGHREPWERKFGWSEAACRCPLECLSLILKTWTQRRNRCRDFTTFVVLTDRHRAANPSTPRSSMALKVWCSISQKHVQQEKLKIKNHINHKLFRLLAANTEICLCHYGNVSLFYKTAALSTWWTSVSSDWNVTCVRQTRNKHKQRNHVAQSHDHDYCSLCNAQLLHQQLDFQPSACPQISLIPCSNQPCTGCEVGICSNQKLLEIKHMMHSGWVQHWQKSERNILIVICTINKHPESDNWRSKTSSRRWSARNPNSIWICNRSLRCLCCLQIALNSC